MKVRLPIRTQILKRKTYEPPGEDRWGKLRLDFNENTAGCSPAAARALGKLTPKRLAMYPEYQRSTRSIARYFGVEAEEVLLANGGDDALRVFFDTFVDPGSNVLIFEPTFPMYRFYAELFGARLVALRYSPQMEFPLREALAALRRKPRAVFIANPNNPTGTLLDPPVIHKLLRAASHTAVIIDEAYAEFSGVSLVPWIGRHPNLFVARTFSKAAGLAGLRLGAVVAAEPSLAMLRRALPPFPVNVAALAATEAAIGDRAAIRRHVRDVVSTREWFSDQLTAVGAKAFPSAGNFLLADFGPSGPALFSRLESEGILLRERSREIAPGFVRITIGTRREMERLLRSIRGNGYGRSASRRSV
jgi:histidinol-phosphate aminotransferase